MHLMHSVHLGDWKISIFSSVAANLLLPDENMGVRSEIYGGRVHLTYFRISVYEFTMSINDYLEPNWVIHSGEFISFGIHLRICF